jgi:serine/threonine protein kinase
VSERPSTDGKLLGGTPTEPVPFGKYALSGLIARGGMAEVYRARPKDVPHGDVRALLAIKVMRPRLAQARPGSSTCSTARASWRCLLAQPVHRPQTTPIGKHRGPPAVHRHGVHRQGATSPSCMRRLPGHADQRLPVPHAVYLAARVAEGLARRARRCVDNGGPGRCNVVNRDVSPSNVRLSYDGDVKLLDFGIAQALMAFTSEIGVLKGKFSYMSPEQIRGMPLDARTDVFSAGIILHEMLTDREAVPRRHRVRADGEACAPPTCRRRRASTAKRDARARRDRPCARWPATSPTASRARRPSSPADLDALVARLQASDPKPSSGS